MCLRACFCLQASPSPSSPSDLDSATRLVTRSHTHAHSHTLARCFSCLCPKTAPTSSPSSFPLPLPCSSRDRRASFFPEPLPRTLETLAGHPHPLAGNWPVRSRASEAPALAHRPGPLSPAKRLQRHQSWHCGAAIGGTWPVLAERGKPSVHGLRPLSNYCLSQAVPKSFPRFLMDRVQPCAPTFYRAANEPLAGCSGGRALAMRACVAAQPAPSKGDDEEKCLCPARTTKHKTNTTNCLLVSLYSYLLARTQYSTIQYAYMYPRYDSQATYFVHYGTRPLPGRGCRAYTQVPSLRSTTLASGP